MYKRRPYIYREYIRVRIRDQYGDYWPRNKYELRVYANTSSSLISSHINNLN